MHTTVTPPPAPTPPARLLTTTAAGRYAGVSRWTLFRAARRGELHPAHLGPRLTRWPVADLDAWIFRATTVARDGGAA